MGTSNSSPEGVMLSLYSIQRLSVNAVGDKTAHCQVKIFIFAFCNVYNGVHNKDYLIFLNSIKIDSMEIQISVASALRN